MATLLPYTLSPPPSVRKLASGSNRSSRTSPVSALVTVSPGLAVYNGVTTLPSLYKVRVISGWVNAPPPLRSRFPPSFAWRGVDRDALGCGHLWQRLRTPSGKELRKQSKQNRSLHFSSDDA